MHKPLAAEKRRVGDEAFSRSLSGLSTEIYVLVEKLGNPLRVVFGPGQQAYCCRATNPLPAAQSVSSVLADKGYDT